MKPAALSLFATALLAAALAGCGPAPSAAGPGLGRETAPPPPAATPAPAPGTAQPPPPAFHLRDIPEAPPSQIFDSVGLFSPDDKTALSLRLNDINHGENLQLYLAIIANLPPDDLAPFARALNEKWLDTGLGGVLVLSFGHEPQFFLLAGGPERDRYPPEELKAMAQRAIDAGLEQFRFGDLRGGCVKALDEYLWELRKLRGTEQPKGELLNLPPVSLPGKWHVFWEGAGSRNRKLIIAAAAAALVVAVLLALWFRSLWRFRPRQLPETAFRHRLGAPCGGGNNIRVDFRRKKRGNR
jgi:uncharacterized membrane protein YgcG